MDIILYKRLLKNIFQFDCFILFLVLVLTSCNPTSKDTCEEAEIKYIHIAHTRTNDNNNICDDVYKVKLENYDMIWLGGDLAHLTSKDEDIMDIVDSALNVSDTNTLWALGNHDYSDLSIVSEYTKRPSYYSYSKNGLMILVLDTQDSLSNIVGDQLRFFNTAIENLNEISHLIILHHKLIWMTGNDSLEAQIPKVSNGGAGNCFYCINPNNFYSDIYPKLVSIKQKGIEVICIGGDIGFQAKEFEYLTEERIYFLASGLEFDGGDNKYLEFKHNLSTKELCWEFVHFPK